jgi:thiol-disulfide isomerase/thioredoxin
MRLVACVVIAMALIAGCERKPSSERYSTAGIEFEDLGGAAVTMESLKGRVVLLEFWATWCPPCRDAIADLNELQARYRERGLVVLGVSIGESAETVLDFMDDHPIEYRVLRDVHDVSGKKFGLITIPASFIIDREGVVVEKHIGYPEGMKALIEEDIGKIL